MKITFTFGSEEVDCQEIAEAIGIVTGRDEDNKVTATYQLKDEDMRKLDDLKKLRMEDLCREFFNDTLAEETVAAYWENR